MFKTIVEGLAKVKVPVEEKISADLPVFYNPLMKLNRDMSVLLLKSLGEKDLQICDPLAGTGVRSVRFLLETPEVIKNITINDKDEQSIGLIKENLELNRFEADGERVRVANKDANVLLYSASGYDYVDIDPFGTPNPFLDIACRRMSRRGILAVTATDVSALAGTYVNACRRKYWAEPRRDYIMHEVGLRILIRKCQLVGAQYDKALVPVFSYSKDHYMRVFFRTWKGKAKVDVVIKQHGEFNKAGPMWLGRLWDPELVEKMVEESSELSYEIDKEFLGVLKEESKIDVVGFFDVHALCKKLKRECPSFEKIESGLNEKGHRYCRTHFSDYGIRTDASKEEILDIIKKC
ncbi:tRNA (guanine(26)-N(2))-dimethyltransferase [Nanoarchaeota archaeon]